MKPKYPSMFCKPKPVITNSYYLYQGKFESFQQQHYYDNKQQEKAQQQIIEESEKPSMGGLGLALDPMDINNIYTDTNIIETVDNQTLSRHKKAKSEIIFSNNNNQKQYFQSNSINPAAMLHLNYTNNNNDNDTKDDDMDTVSCIHGHYNPNYMNQHKKSITTEKLQLIKSNKLNVLIPDLLQYRVIQCGYITKQGKIRKNWKKRFALLLCAKIDYNLQDEKQETECYYQFKLLYFEDNTLSKLKGVISFNNLENNIGLIAPKSTYSKSHIFQTAVSSKHLSTPIRPRIDNVNNSLSVSISLIKNEDSNFYKLLKKNQTLNNLQHMWSSFPNNNGFYIIDKNKNRTWFIDTNTFENAQKWLLSIWEINKYFNQCKKSKKLGKNKLNLKEMNEMKEIEMYGEKELCIKNGFSDFVSMGMDGYVSINDNDNKNNKYNTLKYMIIIPNQCHIRFKGILVFDCIDNKYQNKKYNRRKRFKPNFYKMPIKIRMKQKSIFLDKSANDKDKNANEYFEIIGDLNKCFCNARNYKSKILWNLAFKHYRNLMNKE